MRLALLLARSELGLLASVSRAGRALRAARESKILAVATARTSRNPASPGLDLVSSDGDTSDATPAAPRQRFFAKKTGEVESELKEEPKSSPERAGQDLRFRRSAGIRTYFES